jgi:hypothetical protein
MCFNGVGVGYEGSSSICLSSLNPPPNYPTLSLVSPPLQVAALHSRCLAALLTLFLSKVSLYPIHLTPLRSTCCTPASDRGTTFAPAFPTAPSSAIQPLIAPYIPAPHSLLLPVGAFGWSFIAAASAALLERLAGQGGGGWGEGGIQSKGAESSSSRLVVSLTVNFHFTVVRSMPSWRLVEVLIFPHYTYNPNIFMLLHSTLNPQFLRQPHSFPLN